MKKKEIIQELKRYGYSRVNIDTDRRTSKHSIPIVEVFISTVRKTCHSTSFRHRKVSDWDGLPYALHGTEKAHSWEQTMLRSFSSGCSPF